MYINIIAETHNVFFECDKVIETERVRLSFLKGDEVFIDLCYDEEEKLRIYAMNDIGRTVNSWDIWPEGKPKKKD